MRVKILLLAVVQAILAVSSWAANFQVEKESSLVAVDAKASPPHTFTSVVTDYVYDISIDPESLDVSKAEFNFSFADMDSDKAKRDKKMLDWMDVDMYPRASYQLSKVVERDGQQIAIGTFTMHGIDREIEVPFEVTREGDNIFIDGEANFSYEQWDLKIVRLFIFTVRPEMYVHFHLTGKLTSAS